MALLTLTAKVSASDFMSVEIEDDETVESLAVVIYSLRPELGEDMRLAHKGRVLKPDSLLAEVGIKNGDAIAVAKAPAKSSTMKAAPVDKLTSQQEKAFEVLVKANADGLTSQKERALEVLLKANADGTLPAALEYMGKSQKEKALDALVKANADGRLPVALEKLAKSVASPEPQPVEAPKSSEKPVLNLNEEEPGPSDMKMEPNMEQLQTKAADTKGEEEEEAIEIDGASAAGLRALADLLERGGSMPAPDKMAAAMREAATKMMVLENAVSEFGQALQVVNMISANSLRSALGGDKEEGSTSTKSLLGSLPAAQEKQEETRSFLHKKGDADLHAIHTAVAQPMARQTSGGAPSNISGSGSCGSPASRPLTKEEMDKARKARLAVLEAKQAEKKKEKEEADEKNKSREALFNRPFQGTGKPLGQI